MSEISVLFPGKEVTLSTGEIINIKPFKFGQLPQALKLSTQIGSLLSGLYQSGELADPSKKVANVIHVISEGGEDLFKLIGLSIGKPRTYFDELESDDGVKLIVAFLEVNIDFFTKKMMPQLLQAMKEFKPEKSA